MKKLILMVTLGLTLALGIEFNDVAADSAPTVPVMSESEWNGFYNNEWISFMKDWAETQGVTEADLKVKVETAMNTAIEKTITDGIVSDTFNWGEEDGYGEWSGIFKFSFKGGDNTADVYGRAHNMIVISQASFKDDGTVEAFVMMNDVFEGWVALGEFGTVGYPTSAPYFDGTLIKQDFAKGTIISDNGTETFVEPTEPVEPTDQIGKVDEDKMPQWATDLGYDEIQAKFKAAYDALAEAGFDMGDPADLVKWWGDGSGTAGIEETKWIRQEYHNGDHTAYVWNRVHGYLIMGEDGNVYAIYNEVLLEWHGGFSDKGGPVSNPIYITVTDKEGNEHTDVYQNFTNVLIVVPDGDRALVKIVPGGSVTELTALDETQVRYGLKEEPTTNVCDDGYSLVDGACVEDTEDPVDPDDETGCFGSVEGSMSLIAVSLLAAIAGSVIVLRKRA